MIGTVPCKLSWDDQLGHMETQGEGQKVRGDDNRARIMSASSWEIVGPGFSSLTKVVAHEVGHEEGESSQEKSEAKVKESGQLPGVPGVQMHGISKVDKESRLPYPILPQPQGGVHPD
jgi:hypothetical protein